MSESCLNVFHREKFLKQISEDQIELLIIGGGITGAGIALDAVSRGIKVALIEKSDFSSGTSSRSTKLIHGGLRYLKQLEISLVRETGRERAIAYKNAPHLVHPEKLILPIVKNGTLGWFSTSFALWIYDFLAGVGKKDRKKMIGINKTRELLPKFNSKGLLGAGFYSEYRSDDSRLTIEIIKKAVSMGALAFNYIEANGFIYENNIIAGVKANERIKKQELNIKARCVINAAGPWVDQVRIVDHSIKGKSLRLSKGVHLVINTNKLNLKHSVYFEAADKRMIFAIPREGKIYFGTTDTIYSDSIDKPKTTKQDAIYLIDCMNKAFDGINLDISDIISSWAGLRPLIQDQNKASQDISRKDEIFISKSGLISIAGGKLTAYRSMAERVVNVAIKRMNFNNKKCKTKQIKLLKQKDYINTLNIIENQLIKFKKLNKNYAYYLWTRYGDNSLEIINKPVRNTDINIALIINEFEYCLEEESVYHLIDFLKLRNARVYFFKESIPLFINELAEFAKEKLDWSENQKNKEIQIVNDFLNEAINFE